MKEKNKEKLLNIYYIFMALLIGWFAGLLSNFGIGILVYMVVLIPFSTETLLEKILVQLRINNVLQLRLLKKKVRGKK